MSRRRTDSADQSPQNDGGTPGNGKRTGDRKEASSDRAITDVTQERAPIDIDDASDHERRGPTSPGLARSTHRFSPLAIYRQRRSAFNGALSLILAVTVWELAAANTSSLVFVSLISVGEAIVVRIERGLFWPDVIATSSAFAIGYVIASIAGILIGLAIAVSDFIHDIFQPWVSALYSTPVIALAPLFIVIFGIGLTSKIAVVVLLAIFPVIINTTAGIRNTEPHLIEGAYAFGANRLDIFRMVLIPAAVPYVITGLRLAVGRGLIGVVVAEFFGARAGLGHTIFQSSQRFDTATLFSGVLILALAGTFLINLMLRLERWIAPWRDFKIP